MTRNNNTHPLVSYFFLTKQNTIFKGFTRNCMHADFMRKINTLSKTP